MSIFGSIMSKIFHHDAAAAPAASTAVAPSGVAAATSSDTTTTAAAPAAPVEVGAVLEAMAASKPGHGGNYKVSIADLLQLLDMDPSLAARKELANELNLHVGADGSAEQNVALHKAVMQMLAENGGHVPDSLRG